MNETDHRLILASRSPRRRELLISAGYVFEVVAASEGAEDGIRPGESPFDAVARWAYQKAADVAPRIESGTIIACDTIALCGAEILGKPSDEADARRMLRALRGTVHHVLSGLCVWRYPVLAPVLAVEETTLFMEPIHDEELDAYLATGAWRGKAGAFGYQDELGWIRIIEGSESNVVGLPMERLGVMLKAVEAGMR